MNTRVAIVIAIILGVATGALALAQRQVAATSLAASTRGQVDPRALAVGAPQTPAVLTIPRAVDIARSAGWGSYLSAGQIASVDYGSFDIGLRTGPGQSAHAIGTRDVWAIRISGLNDEPSAPPVPLGVAQRPSALQPMHFMTVFVDDKAGTVVRVHED